MEIPIQVAVRIYPCLTGASNTKQHTIPDAVATNDENDDNGNPNDAEDVRRVSEDEDGLELGNRCCVQAIPMAAPNFLPGAQPNMSMHGQLANGIVSGIVQVGQHSFPVTHSLPINCTQNQIYHQSVFPLISLFVEGFDASVVAYGQRGTGKSYTLFGPGVDCVYDGEAEQGVVQRCVREIFAHMSNHPERTYAVNIGWVVICGETIRDLLRVGNVHCQSIADVFHWMEIGMAAKAQTDSAALHSLFTLTLEQQWVTKDGLIQHRLSTASFSDLCGTERIFMLNAMEQPTSIPKDLGLQALEQVVNTLTDPVLMYGANGNIPYNRTTLTTLLKDSFGGRAQTLVILCVSPLERDINETIYNLQFTFKVQCVRNYVLMNTFSDDNTPISPDVSMADMNRVGGMAGMQPTPSADNFGLQFAASQWFKLVSNAEGLFAKLVSSNALSELDKEQIQEWLFLKQECEECLSSSEVLRSQKQLGPIQEAEEPDETVSDPETSCQQNSDNESDSESQRPDLEEKLETLMEELRLKTDSIVQEKYKDFLKKQPKAVMESQESFMQQEDKTQQAREKLEDRRASIGGRRRSIQPGASLSSAEIAMLNRVASREQTSAKLPEDFLDSSSDLQQSNKLRAAINSPVDSIQKKLRKLDTDIEAHQRQIKEVEQTVQLQQNIITELVKNNDTRTTAKQRFNKKKGKLEAEYEKTKKQLGKAIVQGKDKAEVERLRALSEHIEHRLQDLVFIKKIAGESGQRVKKLQQSVHESKKLIDDMQKKMKKEKKLKEQLELELKNLRDKENQSKALVKADENSSHVNDERGKNLKEVQARISHLDHVLKEKSENLEQFGEGDEKESLRHEIRNLRRTRDHLLEQRCSLDRKLKREKMLTQREERKLLECDEAIEAIDAAIEFKNELICGHKSIDTSERLQREKGEQMLMARLNKLSQEEMRTLLYKYFIKVIDLRDSSRKLEVQLMNLERERDAWEWKERVLSNAVRQARLEGERNAVLLQRQHETKLTLMLRHFAEETSANSSYSDARYMRGGGGGGGVGGGVGGGAVSHQQILAALHHHQQHMQAATQHHHAAHSPPATTPTNTTSPHYSDSEFEMDFPFKSALPVANGTGGGSNKMLKGKHNELEMCPLLPDALNKYKPLDKLKDKERETKNKLFAKFQVLTRYAGQAMSNEEAAANMCAAAGNGKRKEKQSAAVAAIPQENLKRLIAEAPATKVTRQKNKIIIQDASRRN